MSIRRIPVALALAALAACTPDVGSRNNPASTSFAVFDPSASRIPLPNDLALQPSSRAAQSGAQKELLDAFFAAGGFPSDQEVPVTIEFESQSFDRNGVTGETAPALDASSLGYGTTLLVLEKAAGATTPAPVNPTTLEAPAYAAGATSGTLTIQNKVHAVTLSPGNVVQSRRWNAGSQYFVLVRGGASGVTAAGAPVQQMVTMYLLTLGVDLSLPENQRLLPGNDRAGRAATGAQLEALRKSYLPLFAAADQVWGAGASKQLLAVQTFQIAPALAGAPITDASAGVVPLPSDLLLDPATNKVVNNPAFGPAAAGLATLDGFSTTAMALSQTTHPVIAATVNAASVFIYDLSNPAAPVRLKEVEEGAGAGFWAEPYLITRKADGVTKCTVPQIDPRSGCFSTAIGLQPAAPAITQAGTPAFLPPLKEGTEYAVLITDGVKAVTGATPTSLKRSTLSSLLLFENPLVDASGKSQVSGQSDATAAGLEKIRQGVGAAAAQLQADKGITKDHVVLGYTYRTQTITKTSLQLAAAPYSPTTVSAIVPAAITAPTFGGQPVAVPALPNVADVFDAVIPAPYAISPTTGALEPDPTKWTVGTVTALVATPPASAVAANCPGSSTVKCAPLVVFHHGLGANRLSAIPILNALTGKGFVVAAIDAPYHGDRALCSTLVNDCPAGTSCVKITGSETQGDAAPVGPPGQCRVGGSATGAIVGSLGLSPGLPDYFVSANLFRTRDAFRHDVLDHSTLVLALARPPTLPAVTSPVVARLAAQAGGPIAIDPSKVYWLGQSLGGLQGTVNVAVNSRFSNTVLNVGGGTITDIFTQSPGFAGGINALLASLGIVVDTPAYLQFVNVTKWILDPADPVNFASHVALSPLPDPLSTTGAVQPAKKVLAQVATCDSTIPNPFNFELYANVLGGLPGLGTLNPSNLAVYAVPSNAPGQCTLVPTNPTGAGTVAHSFLLGGTAAGLGAQADAANFLADPAQLPAATRTF